MLAHLIKRKITISMLFIGLTLLGYISYRQLPVEMLPDVELPFLIVLVNTARDLDPQYMEKEAIVPVESSVSTLESVEKIESFAGRTNGRVMVYYKSTADMKYAFLKLQEKIDAIRSSLSSDFIVQVLKVDSQDLSNMFMNLQVRGGGDVDRIRSVIDRYITTRFESLDGIASVQVFGGHSKAVQIVLDNEKSDAYGITPSKVRNALAQYRQSVTFAGYVNDYQLHDAVNVVADYTDISQIKDIIIDAQRGLRLKDVASVYRDVQEETSISRVNGQEAVTIQLVRDTQVNLIDLAHKTRALIDKLNKELAWQDVQIVIQQDSAEILEQNIDLIINLALSGGLLVVLILWYFIRNLRLVMVVALTIPVSVLTAFNIFYAADLTINNLTLVGAALAIGMLVDNSVVVLENIYREIQRGGDTRQAVIRGTTQIVRSVSAATLTTIAVFLPFVFASQYFVRVIGFQIGISIISTLIISLVVALLLIPAAAYAFFSKDKLPASLQFSAFRGRLLPFYNLLLKTSLRFPARTIVITIVAFFATLLLALTISQFNNEQVELDQFSVYVTMPAGATLESTDLAVKDLETKYMEIPEIEDVVSQIYEQEAVLTLKLKENFEDIAQHDLGEVKDRIGGIGNRFRVADVSFEQPTSSERFRGGGGRGGMGGGLDGGLAAALGLSDKTERVIITGRDYDKMTVLANDIESQLDDLSSVDNASTNIPHSRPEIDLLFDRFLLARLNIPLSSIATELSTFQSQVSTGLTFKDGNDEYDIVISNENLEEKHASDLKKVSIPSSDGATYPLGQISTMYYTSGSGGINRTNQERRIEVRYSFENEINASSSLLEAARNEVDDLVNSMTIPAGIAVSVEHEELDLSDFYFLFVVSFILIYIILASVFESLLKPFVIMFTVPLAAIGSLWAIILTGNSLMNVNALIGFLILLGIVVNNGIILIDYIQQLRRRGFKDKRAIIVSGQARMRPILITALTTIIAMIPLALGSEEYVTVIAAPFAIAVIGGLSFSTVFTLLFVPTVYAAIENVLNWFKNLHPLIKTLQILLLIGGSLMIYLYISSLLWQIADFMVLLFVIPGLTWFIMNSLRSAQADYIPAGEDIRIDIRNVYKQYDRPGRFRYEWRRKRNALADEQANGWIEFANQHAGLIVLTGFLLYFIYFYLESLFWIIVLQPFWYLFVRRLWQKLTAFRRILFAGKIATLLYWLIPLFNIIFIYERNAALAVVILVALIWLMILGIRSSGRRLETKSARVRERSTNKWVTAKWFFKRWPAKLYTAMKRGWYTLVKKTAYIGKARKPFTALKGVTLTIESGMFGLLGPNGAGKTTLMRVICGILDQSFGTITINGFNVTDYREELQGLIGYLPQDFGMYENLTALEFLNYQAILKGITNGEKREKRIEYVLNAVHLGEKRHVKIASFSGGMKQRMGIAQTLLHLPRILVVDEPTAGLDPRERIRFRNLLVELSRERVVIFSTHVIEDIASSCNRVAVMNQGEVCYLGPPQEMARQAEGKIWQDVIPEEQLDTLRESFNVVHHIRVDEGVRVRIMSPEKPSPKAIVVKPTLEDAYLWLLQGA